MNLLMVNDAVTAVDAMKEQMTWERYGISQVYVACNVEEGKKIMAGKTKQNNTPEQTQGLQTEDWLEQSEPQNSEHQKMLEWLKTVKFRRVLVNGVDEADVWRKLEELNHLYEASLTAERVRYEALLDEYKASADAELNKYKLAVRNIKGHYDEMLQMNYELSQKLKALTGLETDQESNQTTTATENREG